MPERSHHGKRRAARSGMTLMFVTPGILLGRFALTPTNTFTFGIGSQRAIAPDHTTFKPGLTPTDDHALILAKRLSF